MTMKVAIYCRVSTGEQTTENQKRDLLRYCDSRKLAVVRVYEDNGVSGAKHDRPALSELMAQARRRKFDAVLVWKFDRFARSVSHLLEALQEFKSLGIDFISFSEGIDTSTPMGKLIYTFLAGIAEFERSLIQERVRCGIRRAQAQGIRCGRPIVAFDMEKAIRLRNDGVSLRNIAKELSIGRGTIHRALSTVPKTS